MALPKTGSGLPSVGTASYNGVTFDEVTRSKVVGKPEPDAAGRAVKFVKWTISITGKIYVKPQNGASITTDSVIQSYRTLLTAPGKALQYSSKGFGTLDVNLPNGDVLDVAWGPFVEHFSFTPIAGNLAALVEWRVSVSIPECDGSEYKNKVMAYTWSVDYEIDGNGLTTITTEGELEIPLSLRGLPVMKLQDNADAYRELINFPAPLSFKRETQKYSLSKDRSKLAFTIVDRQLVAAFPPGVTNMELRHRFSNAKPRMFVMWNNTISGSVTVAPDQPKETAWNAFLQVATKRLLWATKVTNPFGEQVLTGWQVIGTRLEVDENLFGLDTRFTLSYDIGGVPLKYILYASGMWQPVGTDWATWQQSMQDVNDPRGIAQVAFINSKDTIVDLCSDAKDMQPPDAGASSYQPSDSAPSPPTPYGPDPQNPTATDLFFGPTPGSTPKSYPAYGGNYNIGGGGGPFAYPPPTTSYLEYRLVINTVQTNHLVVQKPLKNAITVVPPAQSPMNLNQIISGNVVDSATIQTTVPDILQRMCAPTAKVILQGQATRLGYPIAIPRLQLFQGQAVYEAYANNTGNQIIGDSNGIPIYAVGWYIVYNLLRPIAPAVPATANPENLIDSNSFNSPGATQ